MAEITVQEELSRSLGRIPSGVGVLSVLHEDEPGALLCSLFQQVSFDPPMISVAIKRGRGITNLIKASGKFVLNILHTGQKKMIAHFGKGFEIEENPFRSIEVKVYKTGIPVLGQALCFLECELRKIYPVGDHELYIGEVIHAGLGEEGTPMLHLRRNGFNY